MKKSIEFARKHLIVLLLVLTLEIMVWFGFRVSADFRYTPFSLTVGAPYPEVIVSWETTEICFQFIEQVPTEHDWPYYHKFLCIYFRDDYSMEKKPWLMYERDGREYIMVQTSLLNMTGEWKSYGNCGGWIGICSMGRRYHQHVFLKPDGEVYRRTAKQWVE